MYIHIYIYVFLYRWRRKKIPVSHVIFYIIFNLILFAVPTREKTILIDKWTTMWFNKRFIYLFIYIFIIIIWCMASSKGKKQQIYISKSLRIKRLSYISFYYHFPFLPFIFVLFRNCLFWAFFIKIYFVYWKCNFCQLRLEKYVNFEIK